MRVSDLEAMDRTALITLWSQTFKTPVPKGLSQTLMRRFLATEIQTRQLGGLPAAAKRALARTAGQPQRPSGTTLKAGGRLLREWNGTTHVVTITEDGYHWQGQTYRSLSVIARTITGAHWSGPRFFGLKGTSRS